MRGRRVVHRSAGAAVVIVLAAALVVSVWPFASRPAARPAPPREHSDALEAWRQAVVSHTPGQRDAAVALLSTWSASQLGEVFSEFERARADVGAFDVAGLLERGALLHADIAILAERPDGTYDLPSDGRSITIIKDGEGVRQVGGTFHWAFARRLLDALPRNRERDEYAEYTRAWYRATAAMLQLWEDHAELEPHLQRGLELFPADAELRLIEGAMHARLAGPRFQLAREALPALATQPMVAVRPEPASPIMPASDEREAAAAAFRAALKADGALAEAHIRLGDVLGADGHHAEALAEIEHALAGPLADTLHYDAWLLAGREQEELGRAGDAGTAYQRAAALFPRARTARLALSRIQREAGDADGARRTLDELAESHAQTTDDPWWLYDDTHVPAAADLFAALPHLLGK